MHIRMANVAGQQAAGERAYGGLSVQPIQAQEAAVVAVLSEQALPVIAAVIARAGMTVFPRLRAGHRFPSVETGQVSVT
jgi:hypothetical protein